MKILLASPRGFCAGVDRAIQIVEKTIEKFGSPVYVRHEIVHNRRVVERLEALGAIFVDELDSCPDDRPVIFSAHGVPKAVPAEATRRDLNFLDATCPLVSKVHVQAERQYNEGKEIILIGHAGHPEVVGTMGQLPEGAMTLLENASDAEAFIPKDPDNLAFCTQTTLSLDDTAEIISILQRRFPKIAAPYKEDICYATTNRQEAVKAIAPQCDLVLVLGAPNSSNSVRLVEVAKRHGARNAQLVESAADVQWEWFDGVETLGVTAGASAPEDLVESLIQSVQARYATTLESVEVTRENVTFRLPRALMTT